MQEGFVQPLGNGSVGADRDCLKQDQDRLETEGGKDRLGGCVGF